jgi:hypothetical protein
MFIGGFLLGAALFVAPAAEAARVYDFKALYRGLGYPSPDYFGSTVDEVMDLDTYTSKDDTFYGEINGYLRYHPEPYEWYGTGPDDAKLIVERLDNIMRRAPEIPGDLVLFRGLGLGWRGDKPFADGEEFTDRGYVSTSVSYDVARYFAIEKDPDEAEASRRAVFVIYFTRPAERGILVDQGEDEVMLERGRKFRVMARKDDAEKFDIYLVQACAGECETAPRPDAAAFWSDFKGETE